MTTTPTLHVLLTLGCNADVYQIVRETQTEHVDVPRSQLSRHWLVYKLDAESRPGLCPDALPLLVRASGAELKYHFDDEFEWMLEATGERFWASRCGQGWLVESCEGGASCWHACDGFAMELALGLRTPSGYPSANRRPGTLRVLDRGARHLTPLRVDPSVFALLEALSHAVHC